MSSTLRIVAPGILAILSSIGVGEALGEDGGAAWQDAVTFRMPMRSQRTG
jgi:hypothetical protein